MKKINKEEIIDKYAVTGVPMSSLPYLCKELGIKEDEVREWLIGQTCGLVGNEALIYPWDLKSFIRGGSAFHL